MALENVSFAYDSVHMIVDNFSLKINRNEKITFIGKSGAGKSTIFKLITGIVSPNKGAVRISDVDSYDFSSTMRKKTFSILFQEPFFLHKTMREEIRLFDENIDDDQILIALQKVGMDKRVELDEKYDPIKYSTGEKMLLNLARIIVNPCEIILLDEMNSQIDSITLEKIIEEVEKISQNRMVVSIEHYGRKLQGCKIVELK